MRQRARASSLQVFGLVVLLGGAAWAAPPKEKSPVAMGTWKGKGAPAFKSALRGGMAKECKIVTAKKAVVIIDGEVTEKGKGVVVGVTLKSPRTGDVVEHREFPFPRPRASRAQAARMGHQVAEMARRAPSE